MLGIDRLFIRAAISIGHGFPEEADAVPDIASRGKKGFKAAILRIAGPETPAEIQKIVLKKRTMDTQAA